MEVLSVAHDAAGPGGQENETHQGLAPGLSGSHHLQHLYANDVAPHAPAGIQEERLARFMQKSAGISAAKLAAKVGHRIEVLVDAQEIDGTVPVKRSGKLAIGEFADVEITGSSDHDLEARTIRA